MTQQITDLDALAGKTIARAVPLTSYADGAVVALAIVFTDGTFFRVGHETPYEPQEPLVEWVTAASAVEHERLRAKFESEAPQ